MQPQGAGRPASAIYVIAQPVCPPTSVRQGARVIIGTDAFVRTDASRSFDALQSQQFLKATAAITGTQSTSGMAK